VTDVSVWLDVLAGSHDRLSDLVCELDDEALRGRSYCDDWTIAQVLSHIGSGAEILGKAVDAIVAGEDPPSRDTFPEIWARWNVMGPREVVEAALSSDGELVEDLEHLGDRLEDFEFPLFGGAVRVDAIGLVWVRLSEHALHTWDVAVALDPRALVDHDAVTLLFERLAPAVARLSNPELADVARPFGVRVVTSDPDLRLDLEVGDAVKMARAEGPDGPDGADGPHGASDGAGGSVLHLPAEAFLRLLYGRLDPAHTPGVDALEQSTLDTLRKVFPGF